MSVFPFYLIKYKGACAPKLIKKEKISEIAKNDTFSDLFPRRSAFEEMVRSNSVSITPSFLFRHLNLDSETVKKTQEILFIKFFKLFFLNAAQLQKSDQIRWIIPIFITSPKIFLAFCKALNPGKRFVLPYFISIFIWILHSLMLIFKLLVNIGHSFFLAKDLKDSNIFAGSIFWQGSGEKEFKGSDKSSELLFLKSLAGSLKEEKVFFSINTDSSSITNVSNRIYTVPPLLRIAKVNSLAHKTQILGWCLQAIAIAILNRTSDTNILIELLRTKIIRLLLQDRKPSLFMATTSDVQGNPSMLAAKSLQIPVAILHYATNTVSPNFKNVESIEQLTVGRTFVDCHFVWNQIQKEWYSQNFRRKGYSFPRIEAVGPIMFTGLAEFPVKKEIGLTVGVFDVISTAKNYSYQIGHGEGFYRLEFIQKFWEDIFSSLQIVFPDPIKIITKQKRSMNSKFYDVNYGTFFDSLVENKNIHVENHPTDENPWLTLYSCDLVIGTPYTSMVDAATFFETPSCFYYSVKDLVQSKFKDQKLLTTKESLQTFLLENREIILRSRFLKDSEKMRSKLKSVHNNIAKVLEAL